MTNYIEAIQKAQSFNSRNPGFPIGVRQVKYTMAGIPVMLTLFFVKHDNIGISFSDFESAIEYRNKILEKKY